MSSFPAALNADELAEIRFINGLNADGTLAPASYWDWSGSNPGLYDPRRGSAHKWGSGTAGTPGGTVTYAFDPGSHWSAAEQATFKGAMALWSDEANVSFAQAASPSQASLVFYRHGTADAPVQLGAGAYTQPDYSAGTPSSAAVPVSRAAYLSIDTSVAGWNQIGSINANGGYGPFTVVHELGHVLGLGHGGPYNDDATALTQQLGPYDMRLWSVMAYARPDEASAAYHASYPVQGTSWGSSDGFLRTAQTPMPLDIAAVQQLYGPSAGGALCGGQTFGFNCNVADASRMFFDFTQNTSPVVTLYDSGSGNTLDLSGFSQPSIIDLNPGTFSSCAGLTNNIGIAYGTEIDNAVGGPGNDTFVTSPFGGAIDGGGGTNTVVLSGSESQYAYTQSGGLITATAGSDSAGGTYRFTDVQEIYFSAGGNTAAASSLPFLAPAPAAPSFTYTDTTTGTPGSSPGEDYAGGLSYLQKQYLWAGQDSVNISATVPNVFLKGGPGSDALTAMAGSNVLDGNTGSNFLVGATGADGGTDTFFVDGRGGATTWSTAVNFHHGDAVTFWGFDGALSAYSWAASDGAAGYQGATIHAETAGAGTPTNASLTFAGMSLADAQSKFAISTGSIAGEHYMYVAFVG